MSGSDTVVSGSQRNFRQLLAYFILFCAATLVMCETEAGNHQSEHKDIDESDDFFLRPYKVHWKHNSKGRRHSSESVLRANSNTIDPHNKQGFQKGLKGHGKHKKHTRHRNKFREDIPASQEKAKRNYLNYLRSEKKYFDYFPPEETSENLIPLKDDEDNVQVIVLLLNDTDTSKPAGERPDRSPSRSRSKREIPQQETYVRENYNYVRNFLAGKQGNKLPPASLVNRINQGGQYYSQGTPNNPWNNRFTQPTSNFYLPAAHPAVPASVPLIKYPIHGIYYNTGTPSGNYPVLRRMPSLSSRFGEDDRVIWEVRYVGGAAPTANSLAGSAGFENTNQIIGGGFSAQARPPQTTTRPPQSSRTPAPPLIHRENRGRGNAGRDRQPSAQSPSSTAQRPAIVPERPSSARPIERSTTRAPPRTITASNSQSEPSRCVWAIVSCCSPSSVNVRYSCFERMGCHGAFWGYNPCADDGLQDAALGAAETFFEN